MFWGALRTLNLLISAISLKGHLANASRSLDPIMPANDTNLFFNHKGIKHFFTAVNKELVKIKDWSTAIDL